MPSRNVIKVDIDNTYYHAYSRGLNKQAIFIEDEDYVFFISLLKRYLSPGSVTDKKGSIYPNYSSSINLLAYCLMPNHIHLFVYQIQAKAMQQLMRAALTSYSNYFNRKYSRRGPLFESRYKATNIDNDAYLVHISRYIHLNPAGWRGYAYSSLRYYTNEAESTWLNTGMILDMYKNRAEYVRFLEDYEEQKKLLAELKWQLANE